MILSDYDIEKRRQAFEEELKTRTGGKTIYDVNYIGHPTYYFFKHEIPDGPYGVCGISAKLLKIYPTETPDSENYIVDLAVISHLPGFYVEELGVEVTSVTVADPEGKEQTAICRFSDVKEVMDAMNEKFDRSQNRPKLTLIINNDEGPV